MENNFIQMFASAGHAVAYAIGPIFKLIIGCVQLYFSNDFTNIALLSVNCGRHDSRHGLVGSLLAY